MGSEMCIRDRVAEGVKESQLEKVAMGGTDNMFGKNYLNRVVILEVK